MSETPCPTAPPLPVEVLERIVKEILHNRSSDDDGITKHDWVKSLSALSLVSPGWTEICQQKLYETVHICPSKYSVDGVQHEGFRDLRDVKLLIAMRRFPHLGKHVKTLVITLPRENSAIGILTKAILLMLKSFPHLVELRIEDEDLNDGRPLRALHMLPDPNADREEWKVTDNRLKDDWFMLSFGLGLIAQSAKSLSFRNLRVSGGFFRTPSCLENLVMVNSIPHTDLDWMYERLPSVQPLKLISLKSLKLDEKSLKDFGSVFSVTNIQSSFPLSFANLEKLSIPIPPVYQPFNGNQRIIVITLDEPAQSDLLGCLVALKELHLWSLEGIVPLTEYGRMRAELYGRDQRPLFPSLAPFQGLDSPMRWLNPSSFSTLTKLTFETRFHLCTPGEIIEDPYFGLFQGGWFAKLTQLEELALMVWINGAKYRELNEVESFGNQWLVLDHAIAPSLDGNGRTTAPHPHLRTLKLTFGIREVCKEEDADHLFEVVNCMVFDRLHDLKALQEQGDLELAMECVAIADCPCGGNEHCDVHARAQQK
ncbi:hypothetical protein BKA70DRAFT_1412257 [Coprinopsis sp. MPI-PUGE-AT-0042]|nr:hypothetical protein BKA70DRAFT_1412257 [Coprinopsis sp. MPI-PUGE-AT-0042]